MTTFQILQEQQFKGCSWWCLHLKIGCQCIMPDLLMEGPNYLNWPFYTQQNVCIYNLRPRKVCRLIYKKKSLSALFPIFQAGEWSLLFIGHFFHKIKPCSLIRGYSIHIVQVKGDMKWSRHQDCGNSWLALLVSINFAKLTPWKNNFLGIYFLTYLNSVIFHINNEYWRR